MSWPRYVCSLAVIAGVLAQDTQDTPGVFGGLYRTNIADSWSGKFDGFIPAGAGPFPAFLLIPGADDDHEGTVYKQMTYQMAMRGFASVSVSYGGIGGDICDWGPSMASSIFDGPDSALTTMCGDAKVDCSKGVAVAGVGQGGFITVLAAAPAIKAKLAYAVGMCDENDGMKFVTNNCRCYASSKCLQSKPNADKSMLRLVTGDDDLYIGGGSYNAISRHLQEMSGYTCQGANCIQPDGSGFYLVGRNDYINATCEKATHALFKTTRTVGAHTELVCDFLRSTSWGLSSDFDWLAKKAAGITKQVSLTFMGVDLACATTCPEKEPHLCTIQRAVAGLTIIAATLIICGCCCLCACCILCCYLARKGAKQHEPLSDAESGEDYEE